MSELTNWLDKMADECDRECRVSGSAVDLQKDQFKAQAHAIAARINWHLRAHDAETREKAMREQMEADLSAIGNVRERHWRDLSDGFQFAEEAIRDAWAKAHPESEKKEANVAIVPYATVDGQPCDGNGRMLPEAER